MSRAVFVDTWGWIALGVRRDARHAETKSLFADLRGARARLITTDYVLDEVVTLLFRRQPYSEAVHFLQGIFESIDRGQLILERITDERFRAAWQLRQQLAD